MTSEQILQESEPFLFGDGERFKNREDALKAAKKKLQEVHTELAMQRMYEKAETEIVNLSNGFRISVILNIPKFV